MRQRWTRFTYILHVHKQQLTVSLSEDTVTGMNVCITIFMYSTIYGSLNFTSELNVGTVTKHDVYVVATGAQCNVCFQAYEAYDLARKLECGHVYHAQCILTWLNMVCNLILSNITCLCTTNRSAPTLNSIHLYTSSTSTAADCVVKRGYSNGDECM